METLPSYKEAHAFPAQSASSQARLEIKSIEISTVMTKRCETTDEELQLIEMRYQQALALTKLEDLFAEGQLDFQTTFHFPTHHSVSFPAFPMSAHVELVPPLPPWPFEP